MQYYKVEPLRYFQFWGGAKDNANLFTPEELDAVEAEFLNENVIYSDEYINELFWLKIARVAKSLGYRDVDDLWRKKHEKEF